MDLGRTFHVTVALETGKRRRHPLARRADDRRELLMCDVARHLALLAGLRTAIREREQQVGESAASWFRRQNLCQRRVAAAFHDERIDEPHGKRRILPGQSAERASRNARKRAGACCLRRPNMDSAAEQLRTADEMAPRSSRRARSPCRRARRRRCVRSLFYDKDARVWLPLLEHALPGFQPTVVPLRRMASRTLSGSVSMSCKLSSSASCSSIRKRACPCGLVDDRTRLHSSRAWLALRCCEPALEAFQIGTHKKNICFACEARAQPRKATHFPRRRAD